MIDTSSKFIVFDGLDGSGKGTQLRLLETLFREKVVFTREPGGSPSAEEIRRAVKDSPNAKNLTVLSQSLLFWAARDDMMEHKVMPALNAGKHVFDDRGDSSTWGFQIRGDIRSDLIGLFHEMRNRVFLSPGRRPPDLYVLFEVLPDIARARALADKERDPSHFDLKPLEYYERVAYGFREFARHHRSVFVDGNRDVDSVNEDVLKIILQEIGASKVRDLI